MGLREWLMIFGGVIVLAIIADGIRRMRKAAKDQYEFDEAALEREAEIQRELPSGSARVVKTLTPEVFANDPIPVLRQVVEVPSDDASQSAAHSELQAFDHHSFVDKYAASEQDDLTHHDVEPPVEAESELAELPAEPKPWRYQSQKELEAQALAEQTQYASYEQDFEPTPDHDLSMPSDHEDLYDRPLNEAEAQAEDELITEVETEVSQFDSVDAHADDYSEYETEYATAVDTQDALDVSQAMAAAHAAEQEALRAQQEQEAQLAQLQAEYEREQQRLEQEQAQLLAAQAKAQAEQAAKEAAEAVDPVEAAAIRILGACAEKRPLVRKSLNAHHEPKAPIVSRPPVSTPVQPAPAKPRLSSVAKPVAKPEVKVEPLREKPVKPQPLLSEEDERNQLADASELLVLNVKSRDPDGFSGAKLLQVALACGMRYGEMQVFHRFLKTEHGPRIQFSMLSSVNPGTFDMDNIDDLSLPSVTFIMGLPAPGNSQECFTYMLETAKVIVKNLNGELRDEQRSVMTPQTVEHYRQRIRDFERKQLTRTR